MRIPGKYLPTVLTVMGAHDILGGDVALFAGWVHTESAWNPWAIRYEPAFYRRYVEPLPNLNLTEGKARATSWGLLQIMGQVAREFEFTPKYLSQLCDPATNLDLAARILKSRHNLTGSWDGALAAYNGGLGGNRHQPYRNQSYVDKVHANAELFSGTV